MLNGETKHAYNEFIVKNSKELNLEIIVISSKVKGAPKGDFDPKIQQYKMKLQQETNYERWEITKVLLKTNVEI